MSKLTRYTQTLFASAAGANQIAEFGSAAAAGFPGTPAAYSGATITPTIVQTLSQYTEGWFGAVDGQYNPAIEDVNAIDWLYSYQLAYLMQQGVAEYDAGTTYFKGSLCSSNGVIYVSLVDNNIGNALPVTGVANSNWSYKDGGVYVNANFNVSPYAGGYLCDVSVASITGSLPAANVSAGSCIAFKNNSFGSNNVLTLSPNGTDKIEGVNASITVSAGQFIKLFCGGAAWHLWNS